MTRDDLKALRQRAGLTQLEMAHRMGLSMRAYQGLEAEAPFRAIHQLAAERTGLTLALEREDINLAPAAVRREALHLASLMTGEKA